ncbi:MAG: hypothetical protein EZS28_052726 [Streblomastix strix]|uniref:Uncharacterized protein n=1 Tax=Streblomastix strix TaxID=222440 RepID=A0A5J4RYT7_9EUKA|nr:MAG: hypothetical protein EZS28_052726 [Streblomastix strix]
MKQPFAGSEEEKKQIIKKQESILVLLYAMLQDREDDSMRKNLIDSGVAEGLLSVFERRELDFISVAETKTFFSITTPASDQIRLQLFDRRPFPGLLRILEHTDSIVVENGINSIYNILLSGSNTIQITETHPHYESLQDSNGVEKIYQLFNRNIDKFSKVRAAYCISIVYQGRVIDDQQMRVEVISYLKTLISDTDVWTKDTSQFALKQIAQNTVNKAEVEKDDLAIQQ